MTDNKLPSLQNVPLPEDKNIIVLNKDKARPKVSLIQTFERVKSERSELDPGVTLGDRTGFRVVQKFKLYNPSSHHTHVWVYALNNGAYSLQYKDRETAKIMTGQKGFKDLLHNTDFYVENKLYPYPYTARKNKDTTYNVGKDFGAVAVPIDQIGTLQIVETRGTSVSSENEFSTTVAKSYEDEFTLFAFAYGEGNVIRTAPSIVALQNTDHHVHPPLGATSKIRLDTRNYLWSPDQDGWFYLSGFVTNASEKSYCDVNYFNKGYEFFYDIKTGHKGAYRYPIISTFVITGEDEVRSLTSDGFYIKRDTGDYCNYQQCKVSVRNSYYHEAGKIDSWRPHLKTDVTIYDGLSPEIDTYDIVVNGTRDFQIPREAIDVIDHHGRAPQKIEAYYWTPKKDQVYVRPDTDRPITAEIASGVKVTKGDNRLRVNEVRSLSLDAIHNLKWTFEGSSDQRHPEAHLCLSFAPITSKSIRTVRVIYNDAPKMTGNAMLKDFEGIGATDDNGDRIQEFRVELVDPNLLGKVALMNFFGTTYALHKGMRYSPEDAFDGKLSLKWVGTEQKPADLKYAEIKVRAFDTYGAGSEPKTYHVFVK